MARAADVAAVAWTFDPPPKVFFGRAEQLTTLDQKVERIAFLGVDHIVVSRFDEDCRSQSAEAFLGELARLGPLAVWVGGDFRFGSGQKGDVAMLSRRFVTYVAPPVRCPAGEVVSSTRIRALRRDGITEVAEALLGWFGFASGIEVRAGRAA
jgi:riboflavin kinase / FMN adenylyltransferase